MKKIYFLFFVFTVTVYFLSSPGDTPYDYFTRLAQAFLRGKYFLDENPPWLNELIPAGENKFYVVYPPLSAILLMPLIGLFGKSFPQQYLAHLLGAGFATLSMALAHRIKHQKIFALWAGILAGFGTIIWFLSSVGSVWYLGQVTAAFFLMAALVEIFGKKRPLITGLLLGAAYLARLPTILALPVFIWAYRQKKESIVRLLLGILPFILFNFIYNYLRFGVFWDKGYFLIPNILEEPWYREGIFHPAYIPRHLAVIFTALPKFINQVPFILPSWSGLAIWITTPAFIFAFKAPFKDRFIQVSWLAIALVSLVIFSHGTTGFAQFGYRFAVDFYPLLIFLTVRAVSQRKKTNKIIWLVLALSVVVNLWGVLWINKMNWVTF